MRRNTGGGFRHNAANKLPSHITRQFRPAEIDVDSLRVEFYNKEGTEYCAFSFNETDTNGEIVTSDFLYAWTDNPDEKYADRFPRAWVEV